MTEPILSVQNVRKHFGGLQALNDIDLELPAGAIMGLMGPNGAGKTTLVNVICGFYKPDAGRIKFKGIDIMRAVRSFDPCLPCGVHMYVGGGRVLKTFHSPMFGLAR